jgi:uncharacterized paraquat-inducible protein A
MTAITDQHCYHHHQREAVVRCPECRRYYCRECVTEHDDRMLCSSCLARLTRRRRKPDRNWVQGLMLAGQGMLGFLLLWYAFYLVGLMLLSIPHAFHEGTVWESGWWGSQ